MDLTVSEIRVLGCLIEKQRTTPDTYPLTLNALRVACNQATNRDPVVRYDDATVRDAMTRLSRRRWARLAGGGRAPKYRHLLDEALTRAPDELALLCVLMLRGPQTPGELKQRTDRLHAFADLAAIQETLRRLIDRELVMQLTRRPGQKEERYAHRLGEDDDSQPAAPQRAAPPRAFDAGGGSAGTGGGAPAPGAAHTAPARAGTHDPPAVGGIHAAAARAGTHDPPAVGGIHAAAARAGTHDPPAVEGIHAAAARAGTHDPPAVEGIHAGAAGAITHDTPAVGDTDPAPDPAPGAARAGALDPSPGAAHAAVALDPSPGAAPLAADHALEQRVASLEAQVAELRAELRALLDLL